MPEIFTCASPQRADAGATVFRLAILSLNNKDRLVKAVYFDWDGSAYGHRSISCSVSGAEAQARILAFNKTNFSQAGLSMAQRVTSYFITQGQLPAGSLSGDPD